MAILDYYAMEAYAQKVGIENAARNLREGDPPGTISGNYWLEILLKWIEDPETMYKAGAPDGGDD